MIVLYLIVVGAAAGFLATRLLKLEADIVTTIAIGILGTVIGGMALRFLAMISAWAAGFVGAVIGALLIVWIWKRLRQG